MTAPRQTCEMERDQRTLGLLLIAPSGEKHQAHDQAVEVQPFGRASERGVDHLKPHGSQRQQVQGAAPPLLPSISTSTTTILAKPKSYNPTLTGWAAPTWA